MLTVHSQEGMPCAIAMSALWCLLSCMWKAPEETCRLLLMTSQIAHCSMWMNLSMYTAAMHHVQHQKSGKFTIHRHFHFLEVRATFSGNRVQCKPMYSTKSYGNAMHVKEKWHLQQHKMCTAPCMMISSFLWKNTQFFHGSYIPHLELYNYISFLPA